MTNKTNSEFQREICEHWKNALNLFDNAKKIQEEARKLPFVHRQNAMNKVVALETQALVESRKATELEVEQAANQREEISRQNLAYLNKEFFRVENQ